MRSTIGSGAHNHGEAESTLRLGLIPAQLVAVFLNDGLRRPQPTQILNEPRDRGAVVCSESARSDRHESRRQSRLG
jgi:hypothetical protein